MSDKIIRKIAVIFVTDVVGFSKLMERNEDQTLQSFRTCKGILDDLFKEYSARIFNTAGDSVLAEFPSAVFAVICAAEFQKHIRERNASVDPEAEMHFRLGLNMGDVIAEGVVAAVKEVGLKVPLVVRLEGTNVEKGKEIINTSGLDVIAADNLKDGAEKIVKAVKG